MTAPATEGCAQGPSGSYCPDLADSTHHMVTRLRGGALVHVKMCSFCGWIDFDDLDAQVREHVAAAVGEAS